ncbi:MAG TPA: serine hydrolase domain-containing protein [Vicinamibacterales bacterium]|nr:serine hydrolase domain-containing protein [Vicinamibacterales bacterium]
MSRLVALGAFAGLTWIAPLAAQESIESRVDRVFADISAGQPGCSLAVTRAGEPVHLRGYGTANLEYGVPITSSSVFHVASVSKQFTAMAVALLVAEGHVNWQDDVRKYIPKVPDFGKPITLRHLVSHTSGLRDQWDLLALAGWRFEADVITQADVLDITARQRAANFDPGAEYLYSNTGFTLLAIVVERVSGESLRAFTTKRIFGPLGMTATHFHDDHNMVVPNRAYGYTRAGDGYRLSIPDFDTVGATSLFTTAEDLAKWDRNFITAQVGGRAVQDDLHTRGVLSSGETIAYAAGLTHGQYRGLATVGHGGADAGYRSDVVRFPSANVSIAVLCSFPNADPGGRARRVADVVLDGKLGPAPAPAATSGAPQGITLPAARLETLVGVYARDDSDALVSLRVQDGALVSGVGQGPGARVVALASDRLRLGQTEVRVIDGPDGVVSLLGMVDGRERSLQKIGPAPADAATRAEYVGTYWSVDLGVEYHVELADGRLQLRSRKTGAAPLVPRALDRFGARNQSITFTRDASGRIDGYTVSTGRVRKVRFDRNPTAAGRDRL